MKNSHRLGIRGRLFIAFGALSAVTLLASVISWLSYNLLGEELDHVVKGNIRTLSQMAELKEQATKITLMAPTLLAVKDEQQRQQVWQALDQNISQMAKLLPGVAAAPPGQPGTAAVGPDRGTAGLPRPSRPQCAAAPEDPATEKLREPASALGRLQLPERYR
ncbi:MCP four helix bundle domain-containing protein [Marinobacterium jannaschii]|uniref:MCP four helix bundle domain-containing protein n=1 Tax=Marinobacterium jannaschii TaxID=64970 RepID=UPI001FDF2C7C|nr:MCP four helix bundle domain-containing protein [Marinobacterium jannaschii]